MFMTPTSLVYFTIFSTFFLAANVVICVKDGMHKGTIDVINLLGVAAGAFTTVFSATTLISNLKQLCN
jgi:hypothetical protein